MTEKEKTMKRYTNAIERRLNLPQALKGRVMNDFISSIQARREAGQSDEEIYQALGTPKQAAAELNAQMQDYTYRKSPWRFAFAAVAIVAGCKLLWPVVVSIFVWLYTGYLTLTSDGFASSIAIIGSVDGPTAVFVTAPSWLEPVAALVLLAVGGIGWYLLGHLKKKP